jgi:peptide methionine sulfoxide reductase MsrB
MTFQQQVAIAAVTAAAVLSTGTATSSYDSFCPGPVQDGLLYNVDSYTAAEVGLPGPPPEDELLVEAICCDKNYIGYAEPNGFYKFPDIGLFRKLDSNSVTTFYDSVCGLPVFQAPIGRSFDNWVSETQEHGWPSFRAAEIIAENTYSNNSTGIELIYSKCGTYLGGNELDVNGDDRYCIDLSCISGNPVVTTSGK